MNPTKHPLGVLSNAVDDPLGVALEKVLTARAKEQDFLRALATQSVLAVLGQPPGAGAAAPERNLVELRRDDGTKIVPLFTAPARLPGAFPPPAVLVRVPFRLVLSVAGVHQYVINPLSPLSWALSEADLAVVRAEIMARGLSSYAPSPDAPWAFRAPSDQWFAVAYALATWFVAIGRVQTAYLYELQLASCVHLVLAVDEPVDPSLAQTLTQVATGAGVPPEVFLVRFLPDEPSHRAGIAGLGLGPFYRRPKNA